jgi:multidrug resistance efflux pump
VGGFGPGRCTQLRAGTAQTAAEAAVGSVEQALAEARQRLDYTRIRVPFDALVVGRSVMSGSTLSAGGAVAMLYSADRVEVELSLSSRE